MLGLRRVVAVLAAAGALWSPSLAAGQAQLPAKPQKVSLDSEAPPGAPPHWLPNERWVMQHWLPFDEERLYGAIGASRGAVWRWLRDDTRTLADLARSKGRDPEDVARRLVAPWRGRLREPARLAVLQDRALRTLTQGHLAQHLLFHSLHQDAIPDNAAAIFGTANRAEFQALRRSELSPLQICRLKGRSRSHSQRTAEQTLRRMVDRAVEGQAMPAVQGRRLLARQLRQLPRWLQQTRYNGPPPLKTPRASRATASNYSNNAVLSADGRRVVFERYEAALAGAKGKGEIAVLAGPADASAAPQPVSLPNARSRRTPRSAYNPTLSGDGRYVAYESADGNLNFAKRYGQMGVYVRDTERGTTTLGSEPELRADGTAVPRSAYNPVLSGDGQVLAFESSEARRGELDVWVRDLRRELRGRRVLAGTGADVYEPALSGDGRTIAVTALARGAGRAEASQVLVQPVAGGRTVRASDPEDGEAFEPTLSRDGRVVAYTRSSGTGTSDVVVRDLRSGATRVLGGGAVASEPSLSADGTRVAFTVRRAAGKLAAVHVADVATGAVQLVSRASGTAGAPAPAISEHPALAADGRSVAFTSDAVGLVPGKCDRARAVYVRDLEAGTTRRVSAADGENRWSGPTKGSSLAADFRATLTCAAV